MKFGLRGLCMVTKKVLLPFYDFENEAGFIYKKIAAKYVELICGSYGSRKLICTTKERTSHDIAFRL